MQKVFRLNGPIVGHFDDLLHTITSAVVKPAMRPPAPASKTALPFAEVMVFVNGVHTNTVVHRTKICTGPLLEITFVKLVLARSRATTFRTATRRIVGAVGWKSCPEHRHLSLKLAERLTSLLISSILSRTMSPDRHSARSASRPAGQCFNTAPLFFRLLNKTAHHENLTTLRDLWE